MQQIKYILWTILLIAIVVGAGYLINFLSSGQSETPGPDPIDTTPGLPNLPGGPGLPGGQGGGPGLPNTPGGGEAKLTLAINKPVVDYYVQSPNEMVFVDLDGQIVRLFNNKEIVLSSTAIKNISGASFSYDGKKVLVVFGGQQSPQMSVFDMVTKTWQPLSLEIKTAAWSPGDYRLAFISANTSTFAVVGTIDTDNPKAPARPITRVHAQDLVVNWPATNKIVVSSRPSGLSTGSALTINPQSRQISSLYRDKGGLSILWSRLDGRSLVFSSANGRGGQLSLVDQSGQSKTLQVLTLPEKCVFSTIETPSSTASSTAPAKTQPPRPTTAPQALICGVPQDQRDIGRRPLPDDFYKKAFFSADNIYRINTQTGLIENLFPSAMGTIDAEQLRVVGGRLYFKNRFDERVYALKL